LRKTKEFLLSRPSNLRIKKLKHQLANNTKLTPGVSQESPKEIPTLIPSILPQKLEEKELLLTLLILVSTLSTSTFKVVPNLDSNLNLDQDGLMVMVMVMELTLPLLLVDSNGVLPNKST